ncbi:SMC-Scp complex subunit ScpB [Suttonella ornithocola]|uniref:Segregation and condensation protein B homolog n=1 Tax=Suttonella ornithocola TaxID=279832 RepID=A0A380MRA6_9GAMM|nr:SMC-Scp complex subunit ScpB [Suttonella ornithocola]SUO94231.1 Segregation and condensation protein B homolog [Suttonella ornithocola]
MIPTLTCRIEALLFTRDTPLSVKTLAQALSATEPDIQTALKALTERYQDSAMAVVEVATGWRLQLRESYFQDILALAKTHPPRYSRAFWETLAFIAYHQPVTRADIDAVRGVTTSSGIYRQLFDLEWIEVVGQREVPGRPELLATTTTFLEDFALTSVADLPPLPDEINEEEKI